MTYILIALLSVFIATGAQMLLKRATRYQHKHWWRQYVNGWVISGYIILFLTMVINIWCMHNGLLLKELCIIESTAYLFVPAMSWFIYDEAITLRKAIAIAVIITGVIVFFI